MTDPFEAVVDYADAETKRANTAETDAAQLRTQTHALVDLATGWLNTPTHDPDPWHRGHTTGMQDAARVILHHLKEGRP